MVEPRHVHLVQRYVQIRSRTEQFQKRTHRRFRDHREMCRVVFMVYLFTVIAQIPATIHTVEPLASDLVHAQVTKDAHVCDVSWVC